MTAIAPRRRFLRFSLRTLFVFLTGLGILGGWYASRYHTARRRLEAIHALEDRQIEIKFTTDPLTRSVRTTRRRPADEEYDVSLVSVCGWKVHDADMAAIGNFPELNSLAVMSGDVTDKGLAHLGNLAMLEHLALHRLPISDASLAPLRSMRQLKWIELSGDGISDATLVHLNGLTQLYGLGLNGTRVSDAGLAQLRGLTQLHLLVLTGTEVTNAGVRDLQLALPHCSIVR